MKRVGVYDAKTHLAALLDEVERGETITITRHGRPIARLTPIEGAQRRRSVDELIEEARRLRKGNRLDGLTLKELINYGRKY